MNCEPRTRRAGLLEALGQRRVRVRRCRNPGTAARPSRAPPSPCEDAHDPGARHPAGHPVRPRHVRVRVAQLDQRREDQRVGDRGGRDREPEHDA